MELLPFEIHTVVERIKNAIRMVDAGKTRNNLLKSLFEESALVLLEKLLECTPYESTLMILVFHLSHLLLHLLLYPDSERAFHVFGKLFTYQTDKLLEKCAHLMPFDKWLCYIDAISVSSPEN